MSVLGYLGSISAPDGATLKEEAHALQCTTAGPYNAIPTDLLRAGSVCGLGIDQFGIRILSLAAGFGTAANSNTLADGIAKISAARENDGASIFALSPEWNKKFLKTSMAHSTMEAYEYVRHLDHAGRIADYLIQNRDFARPIAARASRILGPISRYLMAQIIPMICTAARAPRPGLAVGVLRVLFNGMCTAQRFHMDDKEQQCRVGCSDEPDSLSHYNECPFFTISSSLLGGMVQSALEKTIRFTTSHSDHSKKPYLWLWVLSTPLHTPTTLTAVTRTI